MFDANILPNSQVFKYFGEISRIPRGSGNTKAISNYLVETAKAAGLWHCSDSVNNVIIIREATAGYEDVPAVMLQGHMDMVCEKDDTSSHDFEKDGLDLDIDGDFLFAKGTTLGGDDGIAVAYMLTLLTAPDYKGPRIECVFTVDEETGMEGAYAIDLSSCKAKRLINLDVEEEGVFITGCAGGTRLISTLSFTRMTGTGSLYDINISGLVGGHSGDEINKKRANAIRLGARLLYHLKDMDVPFELVSFNGGAKDNAIPRSASITICSYCEEDKLRSLVDAYAKEIASEYYPAEKTININLETDKTGNKPHMVISDRSLKSLLLMAYSMPNGVIATSKSIHGLTETSVNLGILTTTESEIKATYLLRSSVAGRLRSLKERMLLILDAAGCETKTGNSYPGWEYAEQSPLRDAMAAFWEKKYGRMPAIKAIHGGLECGIIKSKADVDIVAIGPDIVDIHTPGERMSISSASRVFDYLKEFLASL
ncbi:MAG: aminoacyl-histidine dipeptidase [Lachnospiraceae bacterium]|jgi:dipeptidase D|nr:aminoacyl-histidine dipeptidase [Lachnospiraceae bacterium]